MSVSTRESIKILLFNSENKLLLMHIDDPKTTNVKGAYHGSFWTLVGGGVELGETIQEAALREVYEETGIILKKNELGPTVWFGAFDLILNGIRTHIRQIFLVGKTKEQKITLANLQGLEKTVVQKIAWFSLEDLQKSSELFYPVVLLEYLPCIFSGNYPKNPIEIDLKKQPI